MFGYPKEAHFVVIWDNWYSNCLSVGRVLFSPFNNRGMPSALEYFTQTFEQPNPQLPFER